MSVSLYVCLSVILWNLEVLTHLKISLRLAWKYSFIQKEKCLFIERGKLANFKRTLWQNYKAYNICKNMNLSHLLCRIQIYLTLFCSFYGSRVINVFAKSLKFNIHLKIERRKSSNFERSLWQNYRAYDSWTNINRSHLLHRFQICLTLYCSFYGSRVINVFAKSLKI